MTTSGYFLIARFKFNCDLHKNGFMHIWSELKKMHGTKLILIVLVVGFIANLQVVLHFSWNSLINCKGLYIIRMVWTFLIHFPKNSCINVLVN